MFVSSMQKANLTFYSSEFNLFMFLVKFLLVHSFIDVR